MTEIQIQEAAAIIQSAERLFISTGAGISRESGVHTFRDAMEGIWSKYDPEELATPRAFLRNPDLVWTWYMERSALVREAQPNPGHYAITDLQEKLSEVTLFTQNTDGLHLRAGSPDLIELHGNMHRYRCFDHCQGTPTIIDLETIDYGLTEAPVCPHCEEAHIRPDVVWFTENLPTGALDHAFNEAEHCDVMVVVGTSGVVQPAASLPYVAANHGAHIIEFNIAPSQITPIVDIFIQGPSGETLPAVVGLMGEGAGDE